jgi:short-subunit dehydrogenase
VHVICPGLIETPLLDTSDPEDLPDSFRGFDVRAHLSALMGEPYPADRLAADVLAALSRDQPIIVTPRRAKAVWWFYRLSPTLLMKAEKLSSRRTRTS